MKKADLDRELSDDEFAWLGARLARVVGGRIPNVEAFDGFMTALAVCPDLIKAGEYMPVIVSGKTKNGGLVFESQEEAERFHGLLFRHWNIITDELGGGDIRMPYLEEDAEGNIKGNDWAKGFLEGTHLRHEVFEPIAANAEKGGPFIALWCLAYEHSEDPELRPFEEPITPRHREEILADMIAGVNKLYVTLRQKTRQGKKPPSAPASKGKIGRNDPCPCGSGKKFKHCCLQKGVY